MTEVMVSISWKSFLELHRYSLVLLKPWLPVQLPPLGLLRLLQPLLQLRGLRQSLLLQ